jgi:hypothetical protein
MYRESRVVTASTPPAYHCRHGFVCDAMYARGPRNHDGDGDSHRIWGNIALVVA